MSGQHTPDDPRTIDDPVDLDDRITVEILPSPRWSGPEVLLPREPDPTVDASRAVRHAEPTTSGVSATPAGSRIEMLPELPRDRDLLLEVRRGRRRALIDATLRLGFAIAIATTVVLAVNHC